MAINESASSKSRILEYLQRGEDPPSELCDEYFRQEEAHDLKMKIYDWMCYEPFPTILRTFDKNEQEKFKKIIVIILTHYILRGVVRNCICISCHIEKYLKLNGFSVGVVSGYVAVIYNREKERVITEHYWNVINGQEIDFGGFVSKHVNEFARICPPFLYVLHHKIPCGYPNFVRAKDDIREEIRQLCKCEAGRELYMKYQRDDMQEIMTVIERELKKEGFAV